MSDLIWNAARHPTSMLARDESGAVFCSVSWHPRGPHEGRVRAVQQGLRGEARSGVVFVPLSWISSEYTHEIDRAAQRMDLSAVVKLSNLRDIGLPVLERQAPEREPSAG